MDDLEVRVANLEGGQKRLSDSFDKMNETLKTNTQMTSDILEVANSLKGFGKTVGWAGKGLLFLGKFVVMPVAFVGGGIYAVFHHGRFPEWFTEMVKALFT